MAFMTKIFFDWINNLNWLFDEKWHGEFEISPKKIHFDQNFMFLKQNIEKTLDQK